MPPFDADIRGIIVRKLLNPLRTTWDGIYEHDDVIKWTFSASLAICAGNSPHKGQWRGALMFSLICVWMKGWINNRKAGDLRRYLAHYDVIVMKTCQSEIFNSICNSRLSHGLAMFVLLQISQRGIFMTRWRRQMETFSAVLTVCAGNSAVNSPQKGQWRKALIFFSELRLNKRLSEHRKAGNLRYRAQYDVIIMSVNRFSDSQSACTHCDFHVSPGTRSHKIDWRVPSITQMSPVGAVPTTSSFST